MLDPCRLEASEVRRQRLRRILASGEAHAGEVELSDPVPPGPELSPPGGRGIAIADNGRPGGSTSHDCLRVAADLGTGLLERPKALHHTFGLEMEVGVEPVRVARHEPEHARPPGPDEDRLACPYAPANRAPVEEKVSVDAALVGSKLVYEATSQTPAPRF
jgi:hypothetical protein